MQHLKHRNDYEQEAGQSKEKVEENKEMIKQETLEVIKEQNQDMKRRMEECFYTIPADCEESQALGVVFKDLEEKFLLLLKKADGTSESIKALMELLEVMTKTQQVYTNMALFNKMKYRVAP